MKEAVGHGGNGYQAANGHGEELCDGARPGILLEAIDDLDNDLSIGEDSWHDYAADDRDQDACTETQHATLLWFVEIREVPSQSLSEDIEWGRVNDQEDDVEREHKFRASQYPSSLTSGVPVIGKVAYQEG